MDNTKSTDRDPETGAPRAGKQPYPRGGADEGGVKGGPVAPVPTNQMAPGDATGGMVGEARTNEALNERRADPSISIESINGEGEAAPDRSDRAGGMIGEGGS